MRGASLASGDDLVIGGGGPSLRRPRLAAQRRALTAARARNIHQVGTDHAAV